MPPEEEEQKEQGKESKGSAKGWILVAVFLLLFVCAGVTAYVVIMNAAKGEAENENAVAENSGAPPISWPLADFIVNLAAPDDDSYLKLDLALGFRSDGDVQPQQFQKELEARRDQLKDLVNMVATSKRRSTRARLSTPNTSQQGSSHSGSSISVPLTRSDRPSVTPVRITHVIRPS